MVDPQTLTLCCGGRYEGEYQKDKMHGKGVYEWSEGARYMGQYRDHRSVKVSNHLPWFRRGHLLSSHALINTFFEMCSGGRHEQDII